MSSIEWKSHYFLSTRSVVRSSKEYRRARAPPRASRALNLGISAFLGEHVPNLIEVARDNEFERVKQAREANWHLYSNARAG
jgi:hypothetical protein